MSSCEWLEPHSHRWEQWNRIMNYDVLTLFLALSNSILIFCAIGSKFFKKEVFDIVWASQNNSKLRTDFINVKLITRKRRYKLSQFETWNQFAMKV